MNITTSVWLMLASASAASIRPPNPTAARGGISPAAWLMLASSAASIRPAVGPARFASVSIRIGPDPRQSTTV